MILKALNKIWNYISSPFMDLRQLYGSPLLEQELDRLTRREILQLHREHLLRRTIEVALIGLIGGVLIGIEIGVSLVVLMRMY